jgi:signal transduction histidine kinase
MPMALLLAILYAIVFNATLHITENLVIERHLQELSNRFLQEQEDIAQAFPKPFQGATVYSSREQLPAAVQSQLINNTSEFLEIRFDGGDQLIFKRDTDKGTFFFIKKIAALEIREQDDLMIQLGFLGFSTSIFFLSVLFIHATARRLSRPLLKVVHLIDTHDQLYAQNFANLRHSPDELNQLTDALVQMQQRVDEHIERERNFTSFASHELRTPLAVIKAATEMLGMDEQWNNAKLHQAKLAQGVRDMEALIDTFLLLAREPKGAIYREVIIDRQLIQEVLRRFEHLLSMRQLSISLEIQDSATTSAPETVINVLLNNLIKNAITHSGDGILTLQLKSNSLVVSNPCQVERSVQNGEDTPLELRQHGIGLQIVSQICDHFGWHFSFINQDQRATASILFS